MIDKTNANKAWEAGDIQYLIFMPLRLLNMPGLKREGRVGEIADVSFE